MGDSFLRFFYLKEPGDLESGKPAHHLKNFKNTLDVGASKSIS